jgi:fructose-1,6-bisphosphatase I
VCLKKSIYNQNFKTILIRKSKKQIQQLHYICRTFFKIKNYMMVVDRKVLTLDEFTIQQMRDFPEATGQLASLLRDIGLAAKRVNVEVNKAGLVDILGDTGSINVQGEEVKKMDDFANDHFVGVLRHGISCAGIASEELDDIVIFDDPISNNSKYICMFDPLDGSTNIDVNVSIGTIFCIYKRISPLGAPAKLEDFLQPGNQQVAAGYIIYGSSTIFVYATKLGVNGFTLDPSIGEYTLSPILSALILEEFIQ